MASRKDLLQKLLKGIETGDADAASVVNEDSYIQHNPQTREGGPGLAELFARLSKTSPKVRFCRVFEDGDFAFAHNEYDFSGFRAAFEVFRFEGDHAVEHWDNIQRLEGPNPSGRGMMDGATEVLDRDKTEQNRALVRAFVTGVLIGRQFEMLPNYVNDRLIQHDPNLPDGQQAWHDALSATGENGERISYDRLHRVLAEGNFVLSVCEGTRDGVHSSFYHLFRIDEDRIAEHWNTVEAIPPRSEWKNDNGKF